MSATTQPSCRQPVSQIDRWGLFGTADCSPQSTSCGIVDSVWPRRAVARERGWCAVGQVVSRCAELDVGKDEVVAHVRVPTARAEGAAAGAAIERLYVRAGIRAQVRRAPLVHALRRTFATNALAGGCQGVGKSRHRGGHRTRGATKAHPAACVPGGAHENPQTA